MIAYTNEFKQLPNAIYFDKKLSDGAKLFYMLLLSLSAKEGYCWASNEYLTKEYGLSLDTIRRYIRELKKDGYIVCKKNDVTNIGRIIEPQLFISKSKSTE